MALVEDCWRSETGSWLGTAPSFDLLRDVAFYDATTHRSAEQPFQIIASAIEK